MHAPPGPLCKGPISPMVVPVFTPRFFLIGGLLYWMFLS